MWLCEKLGFVTLSDEDQAEYTDLFEKGMKQSRKWISSCYVLSVFLYISTFTPLLICSGTNVFTTIGIAITLFSFLLCTIIIIELLANKSTLSRTRYFPFSLLQISRMVVIFGVLGGCFQFIGRIMNGRCEEDENHYSCNPLHDEGYYPSEIILLNGSFVLFSQIVGCMNDSLIVCMCWVPLTFTLLFSALQYQIVDSVAPMLALFFMFLSSVKHSTHSKSAFLSTKRAAKADREALELVHQAQVLEGRIFDMRHILGNVSHDLKTPMQAFSIELVSLQHSLVGMEQSEQKNLSLEGKNHLHDCKESINTIEDITRFMHSTINRCLDYTKASSGLALTASNSSFELREALHSAINCIRRSKANNNISLECISDDISDYVISDRQWLMENMICLLSNAVKFGMDASVEVRCFHTDKNELLLEVEDNGIGIPQESRPMLFHPFQQSQRIAGGTGLGLYSLAKRVECMKGQYGIRNRNDNQQGCCFWFTIPYVPDNAAENQHSVPTISLPPQQKSFRKFGSARLHPMMTTSSRTNSHTTDPQSTSRKGSDEIDIETVVESLNCCPSSKEKVSVLLVDDAIVIQKTIGGALRRRNFDVSLASNGLIGLNMMKEKRFDIVLMDLQMPIMDGHEAVRSLRAFEKETGVCPEKRQVIIAISANADDDTIKQTSASGMNCFLAKPFSMDNLNKVCAELKVHAFMNASCPHSSVDSEQWRQSNTTTTANSVLSERILKNAYSITPPQEV